MKLTVRWFVVQANEDSIEAVRDSGAKGAGAFPAHFWRNHSGVKGTEVVHLLKIYPAYEG